MLKQFRLNTLLKGTTTSVPLGTKTEVKVQLKAPIPNHYTTHLVD